MLRPGDPAISVDEGEMLSFAATMELLSSAGIPTAPFHLVADADDVAIPAFPGPYVVKLADVAHRTDHDAVRLNVTAQDLEVAVRELRTIAADNGLPALVAVQPMLKAFGEAFVGVKGSSELGPIVVFGLGGIFVEVLGRVSGRLAPLAHDDAAELLDEFSDTGVLEGFRGAPPWDRDALVEVLLAASRLAAGGRSWIESIDINPLMMTPAGPVAVDGLCLVQRTVSR